MTNEFIREARYAVLKNADVMQCLTVSELIELRRIQAKVEEHRAEIGKPPLDCVVVESDWPEYEPTWRAIEARVMGAQPAPSFADAYQGAMEDVAIWKRRALEAEDLNRKFIAEINGPTHMGEPTQHAAMEPTMQDALMKFDPATGEERPYPSHAAQWRNWHGGAAWLFNPWTGERRNAHDVGSDVHGLLIVPTGTLGMDMGGGG